MKKLLLLSFAFLFSTAMMAQSGVTLLSESFDGTSIPSGWSVAGQGLSNWYISNSSNAGGIPNELMLYWNPQFNGISRFVSPAIDLTGQSNVVVSFKHALANYSGAHTLGIATSSDDGATWNVGWSQNYSTTASWSVLQLISTPDMGHNNVRFCIFYQGNAYNINNWYFDDIEISTLGNFDLLASSIVMPDFYSSDDPNDLSTDVNVGVTVVNYGATPITSLEATCEIEGFEPYTQTFNVNLSSLASTTLQFSNTTNLNPGGYIVNVSINKVNGGDDENLENNYLSKVFSVAIAKAPRIPMIEHFSSSTCGPCVSVNNAMNSFCNNYPGRFTYTKYQMNWPGNGDPYYTAEGGVRRDYYSIGAVPNICFDATNIGSTSVSQALLEQHEAQPAYFDMRGSFTVDGNNIHVIADIEPYVSVTARVYISINEKITHNNVGSNGETSFHHVFMKMWPDGEGSEISFNLGEIQRIEFTQDMSGTNVEEMSDLEVAIWVQNYDTKYLYNSHFAYEYTDLHPYPVENLTLAQNGNTYVASWEAPSNNVPMGYNVFVNGQSVLENTTELGYTFEGDPDGFYVVEVSALYEGNQSSVKAIASVAPALEDMGLISETSTEVVLDVANPIARISVANANYNTQQPIQVLSVTEAENEEGVPYLEITPLQDLPATLQVGENLIISLVPAYPAVAKSVAHTTVLVESDAGSVEFFVAIDGELLSVTELSAETKMYPNPASANVIVEGVNVADVEVYNLVGQKVFEQHGQKLVNINTANWNKGMYLVSVTNLDGKVETMKLMVK